MAGVYYPLGPFLRAQFPALSEGVADTVSDIVSRVVEPYAKASGLSDYTPLVAPAVRSGLAWANRTIFEPGNGGTIRPAYNSSGFIPERSSGPSLQGRARVGSSGRSPVFPVYNHPFARYPGFRYRSGAYRAYRRRRVTARRGGGLIPLRSATVGMRRSYGRAW